MLRFGPFILDAGRCELHKAGRPVRMERKVFDLLHYLIEHRGRIVTNQELLDQIWVGTKVSVASVRRVATLLRTALEDDPRQPRWIATVHGRGYRFIGEIDPEPTRRQLTSSSADDYRHLLVGRQAEQRLMEEAVESATAGASSLLLVEGEAGIGKSRLLQWCADQAATHGARALLSACREEEGAPPLWPWIQISRKIATFPEARFLGESGRHVAPALARLFPELQVFAREQEPARASDPRALRFQAYEGMLDFLRALSARRPLVLLFDDLHRADASSIALLEFLISQGTDLQVLFVCSMRPEGASVLASIAGGPRCRIVSLKGLAEEHVRTLVEAAAPNLASERLAAQIWRQTGGNPFFILSLAATPDLMDASGSLAKALPVTVRSAIEQQCRTLSLDALAAMRAAAVLGREFSATLLAEVLDQSQSAVLAALDEALRARLLQEDPERTLHYRYVHLLVRDALYQGLGSHARSQLHWRVGAVLEARYSEAADRAAELAYHFSAAGSRAGMESAIRYHSHAGAVAAARFDYSASILHYREALQLLESLPDADPRQRCDLLLAQARHSLRAGFSENAGELWIRAAEQARAIPDPGRLGRAALELAAGFDAHGHVLGHSVAAKTAALLEEAIAQTDPGQTTERARLFARLTHVLEVQTRTDAADRTAGKALDLAREAEDPLAMAEVLTFQHWRLRGTPDAAARASIAAELVRHAEEAGDHGLQLAYQLAHAADLAELGRFDDWDTSAAQHARLAEMLRSPEGTALAHRSRAMRLLMLGRFAEARAYGQRAVALAQHCEPRVLFELGQVIIAIEGETVGASATVLKHPQLASGHAGWSAARLFLLLQLDSADLVREGLANVLDQLRPRLRCTNWQASAALVADAIVYLNDVERAGEVLDWLRGFESLHAVAGVGGVYFGPVRRYIGRLQVALGCWRDGVDSLEQAFQEVQALRAVPFVSRLHMDLAECYSQRRRPRDRERAATHAHAGTRIAEQYGMTDLERRGRRLLAHVSTARRTAS
jgi:eukaryotic-like serine/threonine-protein kinase